VNIFRLNVFSYIIDQHEQSFQMYCARYFAHNTLAIFTVGANVPPIDERCSSIRCRGQPTRNISRARVGAHKSPGGIIYLARAMQ